MKKKNLLVLLATLFLSHATLGSPNNYCSNLKSLLHEYSSQSWGQSYTYKCFKKGDFYYISSDKFPGILKKIPANVVNNYYQYQDTDSRKNILEIIFIKGIK